MALIKNSAILLSLMALMPLFTTPPSCHAVSTQDGWSKQMCFDWQGCTLTVCRQYCSHRGLEWQGAFCNDSSDKCCCQYNVQR
uniref:Knottin scorpion toxin-like domain-containing protein n=1 Tax=Oryza brachyantha TaxID=4533 RepID=J3N6J8_ORYBR